MKYLKKIFYHTCITFTIITFLLFLIASTLSAEDFTAAIDLTQFYIILGSSSVIAVANQILYMHRLPIFIRFFMHYLFLEVTLVSVFVGIGKIASEAAGIFVIVLLFTLIYALVIGLVSAIFKLMRKKQEPQKHYTRIYGDKK